MSKYQDILAAYDSIHRSPINRASHLIGIPLIMTAVAGATSFLHMPGEGQLAHISLASILILVTIAIVLSWSPRAALAYMLLAGGCYFAGLAVTRHFPLTTALFALGAMFVLGWIIQFTGHAFEGKSPQFVKRPENLLLGPIMVMAEIFPSIRPR